MRYVQLRAFHFVATTGGFSRAAEALHLTQPAISDQIRKLETEYDLLLFNRHKRRITLTPAGEKLLEITNRLFENERQARELLSESRALGTGTLRIIADSAHHVNPVLGRFRTKYPNIKITMRSGNTQEVIDALFAFEADVGVLGEQPDHRDLEVLPLGASPIIAFAARDYPAPLADPDFAALQSHPLILREQGSKTRQKLEDAARTAGYPLTAAIEVEGREAVREVVATGAGIGFVSAAEYGHDDRFRRILLAGEPVIMQESLICLRERRGGKLVSAFMALAET